MALPYGFMRYLRRDLNENLHLAKDQKAALEQTASSACGVSGVVDILTEDIETSVCTLCLLHYDNYITEREYLQSLEPNQA